MSLGSDAKELKIVTKNHEIMLKLVGKPKIIKK